MISSDGSTDSSFIDTFVIASVLDFVLKLCTRKTSLEVDKFA